MNRILIKYSSPFLFLGYHQSYFQCTQKMLRYCHVSLNFFVVVVFPLKKPFLSRLIRINDNDMRQSHFFLVGYEQRLFQHFQHPG